LRPDPHMNHDPDTAREHRHARRPLYALLDLIARHVRGFRAAFAAFLTLGVITGIAAVLAFAAIAALVSRGVTQRIDEGTLRWFAARRTPLLDSIMIDITTLGNGVVLI